MTRGAHHCKCSTIRRRRIEFNANLYGLIRLPTWTKRRKPVRNLIRCLLANTVD
jgi:hypothetical protein